MARPVGIRFLTAYAFTAFVGTAGLITAAKTADGAEAGPLMQPQICSAITTRGSQLNLPFCRITPSEPGSVHSDLTVALTATTSPVQVGGYRVETENYNGTYLPPILELNAGDTLRVRLLDALEAASQAGGMMHDMQMEQATNLHTHGLIVSPNNAADPTHGNGDNVFVSLRRGEWLDYSIKIPTALPASILDGTAGTIPHPGGLYWYHSHIHGLSAMQVAGGMSGVMSIGPSDANVVARDADPIREGKLTSDLRAVTDTSYLMLRDIRLNTSVDPSDASDDAPAQWVRSEDHNHCAPSRSDQPLPATTDRKGFCRSPKDANDIWLFTVNGQRYPTIDIGAGHNGLWRIANLSADVTYDLRIVSAADGSLLPFDLLSVDGVVPGKPLLRNAPVSENKAVQLSTLTLMPAARAEIYVRNDAQSAGSRTYFLRTGPVSTGSDPQSDGDNWPEIQLAKVILEASPKIVGERVAVDRNLPYADPDDRHLFVTLETAPAPAFPTGCVRDIDRSMREHRRVMFAGGLTPGTWRVQTDLMHPPQPAGTYPLQQFAADKTARIGPVGFDAYLDSAGEVDWSGADGRPKHACVQLSNGHGQLWELKNPTTELHNFHIHQMKFRLAINADLTANGIDPETYVAPVNAQLVSIRNEDRQGAITWHDTLPIPANGSVFVVMNFDAQEQIGKFVYHCHILKHEDAGLMAPFEVVP
ncbi:multicopper oxidase domain-containing protein [Mesorhizobium australicum]|uniref:multicopper oxidase family protein n=1 Tax=Mesorhizobium australicum TaxID=536018 RepID=UPI003338535A